MSRTERISKAYNAFNRQDAPAVFELMTEDVDWPNAIEGTRLIGYEAIGAYWAGQWASIDPQVTPIAITELDGDQVAVRVHQMVRDRAGDVLLDRMVDHVYTFRGELISRMDIREPDGKGSNGS
jgi:ketosteroid isomerase-like protein